MQDTIKDTIQDMDIFTAIERLVRKVVIMMEIHKWSRTARRAIIDRDFTAAKIAMTKLDELNRMI